MNLVRLRTYETYGDDGFTRVKMAPRDKKEVFVALIMGFEPLKLTEENKDKVFDFEEAILKLADDIRAAKKGSPKKRAVPKKKKTVKKRKAAAK